MKLKCRINDIDYDLNLVQGCTFTDNFNETLDSGTIYIDQIPEIEGLKPYTDVFIWNADEKFDGYYNEGDYLFPDCETTIETEISSGVQSVVPVMRTELGTYFSPQSIVLRSVLLDVWFDRFLNYNEENEDEFRFLINNQKTYFKSLPLKIEYSDESNVSHVGTIYLKLDNEFYNGSNILTLDTDDDNLEPGNFSLHIECNYDINDYSISFNSVQIANNQNITITNIYAFTNMPGGVVDNRAEIDAKVSLTRTFTTTIDIDNLRNLESFNFSIKYLGRRYKGTISSITAPEPATYYRLTLSVSPFTLPNYDYGGIDIEPIPFEVVFNVENNQLVGIFTNPDVMTATLDNIWAIIDDFDIDFVSLVSDSYSTLPSGFYKHMLIDSFRRTRLQLNSAYNDKTALFKYEINLFSETKKLEKIILPNISITQSLIFEEKRSCWDYLEKFVDLYSPKYKKTNNTEKQTWSYIPKYYVSRTPNPYLTNNVNAHIVTNLKEVFKDVICPEFSLTNPSLKDVLAQIMITKDLIPVVFNDVIYGLDIGATNYQVFNRNGTNFDSTNMDSENYATDARREYDGALSQENSAHLIEYLGFRTPNSTFLTLENLVLETRFPIYKINSIKMCYYKKFSLYNNITHERIANKAFMCKYDITPLVLQNTVRNTLSTNWETFNNYDNITSLPSIEERMKFVAQYKLCTVGYDIGSNQITGWGTKYEYLSFLWFNESKTYIENIIHVLEAISNVGTEIYDSYLETLGNSREIEPGYGIELSWDDELTSLVSFGEDIIDGTVDESNIPNKLKSIVFEVDYDAMYNGAVIHSKDYVDDDDIVTADNCSSALTVLEADGLLEKEKMNRMSNPIFKIPARYDNGNGGASFNRVQQLATYDELTDSIIYSREYQFFENVIIANYESTKEYVLKNYFTSVWAKYRTYSLMSYSESIKRADNFRELLILSKNANYYEEENLIANNPEIKSSFLSFLTPTVIDEVGTVTNDSTINCGYYIFNDTKYLSDINSFTSGNSICFNIAAYDNISGGNYIDNMAANEMHLSIQDNFDKANYKTTQLWYNTVNNESDAFVKDVGIYFCHLDNASFWKDGIIDEADVKTNANRFLKLPAILDDISDYQSKIIGGTFTLNKDNKEKLDTTFQFDYIANYADKDSILFSSWLAKLNDLIGTYKKFAENQEIKTKVELQEAPDIFIYQPNSEVYSKTIVIKMLKSELQNAALALSSDKSVSFYNASCVPCEELNKTLTSSTDDLIYNFKSTSRKNVLTLNSIVSIDNVAALDSSTSIKIDYNYDAAFNMNYKSIFDILGIWKKPKYYPNIKLHLNMDLVLDRIVTEDNEEYCYFKGTIPAEVFYVESVRQTATVVVPVYWNSNYRGSNDVTQLNSTNSTTFSAYVNVISTEYDVTDETNMVIIVSTNKLNNTLLYNSFKVDENNDCTLPQGMYFYTNGFNDVVDGKPITDIFQPSDTSNYITVQASVFNDYPEDIKSIQYYYKDDNGWLHFVFGVNVDKNESHEFEDFNIYLSCVSKRSMKVYNYKHVCIGSATNYLDESSSQQYGTGQFYTLKEDS